jgi:hypothetical protein
MSYILLKIRQNTILHVGEALDKVIQYNLRVCRAHTLSAAYNRSTKCEGLARALDNRAGMLLIER